MIWNRKKRVKTNDLYELAFYMCFGGRVITVDGDRYNAVVVIEYNEWVEYYKNLLGLINYRKYAKARYQLKRIIKKKLDSFTFEELAIVKPVNKKRYENLGHK